MDFNIIINTNSHLIYYKIIYKFIQSNTNYILVYLYMYTHNPIILYMLESNFIFMSLFKSILLYSNLTYLIVEFKIRLKHSSFTK